MTVALACVAVLAAGVSLLPESVRPWNLSPIGALALFAAARLGFVPALALVAVAIGVKDLGLYLSHGWPPAPLTWVWYAVYAGLGWSLLRRTESPLRIGGVALGASVFFFLASNFVSWLGQALPYGYSLAGLADCYAAAIPFYRGTLAGDLIFTGLLFGLHVALSRAYFPAEQVVTIPVEDRR
jgi:hypothetical protein